MWLWLWLRLRLRLQGLFLALLLLLWRQLASWAASSCRSSQRGCLWLLHRPQCSVQHLHLMAAATTAQAQTACLRGLLRARAMLARGATVLALQQAAARAWLHLVVVHAQHRHRLAQLVLQAAVVRAWRHVCVRRPLWTAASARAAVHPAAACTSLPPAHLQFSLTASLLHSCTCLTLPSATAAACACTGKKSAGASLVCERETARTPPLPRAAAPAQPPAAVAGSPGPAPRPASPAWRPWPCPLAAAASGCIAALAAAPWSRACSWRRACRTPYSRSIECHGGAGGGSLHQEAVAPWLLRCRCRTEQGTANRAITSWPEQKWMS